VGEREKKKKKKTTTLHMRTPPRKTNESHAEPLLTGGERASLNASADDFCDLPPVRKNRGVSISGKSIRSGLFPEEYDACYRPRPDGTAAPVTPGRRAALSAQSGCSSDSDGAALRGVHGEILAGNHGGGGGGGINSGVLRIHDDDDESGNRSRTESSWRALFGPQTYLDLVDDLQDNPQMADLAKLCLAVAACCSHVFLALRIDGYVDWDWLTVLLPEVVAGIVVIVLLIGEIVALVLGRGLARAVRRCMRLAAVALAIVLVLISLWLIVTRVKHGPGEGRSFVWAFSPIYVVQAALLVRDVRFFVRKIGKWARGRGTQKPLLKRLPRIMLFVLQLPILAFTIVLPIALEAYSVTASSNNFWWISFTPLWVFMPLLVLAICFSTGKAALADVAYAVAVVAFILVPWSVFLYRLCSHLQAVADARQISEEIPLAPLIGTPSPRASLSLAASAATAVVRAAGRAVADAGYGATAFASAGATAPAPSSSYDRQSLVHHSSSSALLAASGPAADAENLASSLPPRGQIANGGDDVVLDFVWISIPCFVSYGCVIVFLAGRILTRAAAEVLQRTRFKAIFTSDEGLG
jgi:hypothetical protein